MKKLESRTLRELLELAREWGLSGFSKLKKNELVKLLSKRLAKEPLSGAAKGGQAKAAGRKPAPAAEAARAPAAAVRQDRKPAPAKARRGAEALPEAYGDGRVVLMTRDPQWLYCFWDLTDEQTRRLWAGPAPSLRLLERAGQGGQEIQRVKLPHGARSWYLRVEPAGKDYLCQLGQARADGGFEVLATSNPSSTPPAGMGPAEPERPVAPPPAPARPAARAKDTAPAGTAPPERFLAASAAGGLDAPASAENLAGLRRRLESGLASELLHSAVHAAGSPRRAAGPEADYWLWVDAEVIIYGGTVPGSRVSLGGEPITLDPSGRFVARFAFPDGLLPFPVEGVSPDGRFSRKVQIDTQRKTRWIKAKG
jgi:hypothetical protein